MKIINNIKFYLVVVSLSLITLTVKYFNLQNDLINKQIEIDNLKDEIYVKDLNYGSLELMWSILEEVNKPLADSIDLQVE